MNKKKFWIWYVNIQIACKLYIYITDYQNNFFSNVKKYSFKGNIYKIM